MLLAATRITSCINYRTTCRPQRINAACSVYEITLIDINKLFICNIIALCCCMWNDIIRLISSFE